MEVSNKERIRNYLITANKVSNRSGIVGLRTEIKQADFDYRQMNVSLKDDSYAENQRQLAKKFNHQIITCIDDDYPLLLRQLFDFPLVLYANGNIARLADENKIAIIGTRKPTYDARKICDGATKLLANYDYTIVSGLALGTDALAHKGALTYGAPTIAILASSVDKITPRNNSKLAEEILAKDGLILSETAYGDSLQSFMYVQRNRLISGLAEKVFIVEAGAKSGSMTTAKHALEQNKEVYAMPGSISNPVARGTNKLIQTGAYPVLTAEDLFGDITEINRSEDTHPIITILKESGILSIEELAKKMELPVNILLTELTLLEFGDKIVLENNNIYIK